MRAHPLSRCWSHSVSAAMETPWLNQEPGNYQPEGTVTASPHRREHRPVTQQPEGLKVAATKLLHPDIVSMTEDVELNFSLMWLWSGSMIVHLWSSSTHISPLYQR